MESKGIFVRPIEIMLELALVLVLDADASGAVRPLQL
jgi:hypothetical protein